MAYLQENSPSFQKAATNDFPLLTCLAAPEERLQAAQQLADAPSLELFMSPTYPQWLEAHLKPTYEVLRKVPPQREPNASHKIRLKALEMMTRLILNEVLKPHAPEIFDVCVGVVRTDNQENSMLAVKIIFDLLRTFKMQMEAQAEVFLELVVQVRDFCSFVRVWDSSGRSGSHLVTLSERSRASARACVYLPEKGR